MMKVLAIVLLCAFAAVQGRSASFSNSKAVASLGENPWLVHLRVAIGTSGLLNTGSGSLINSQWVLTAAETVDDARFVWIRYGVVNVINPGLVTESSTTRLNLIGGIGLLGINRVIQPTANIAPVSLVNAGIEPETSVICGFGGDDSTGPGEVLQCFDVALESEDDKIIGVTDDGELGKFDIGAPLVVDGVQIGVLTDVSSEGELTFVSVAPYVDWIENETGIEIQSEVVEIPQEDKDDALKVNFVN